MFPQQADPKKVQTYLNVLARDVGLVRAIVARQDRLRAAWSNDTPDVTGTPLEGVSLVTIAHWLDELKAWSDTAVADGIVAAHRPGHREEY